MVSSSLFRSAGIARAFLRVRTISADVTLLQRQLSPECAISDVTYDARAIVALASFCTITRHVPYFAASVAVHMIPSQHRHGSIIGVHTMSFDYCLHLRLHLLCPSCLPSCRRRRRRRQSQNQCFRGMNGRCDRSCHTDSILLY